MNLEGRCGMWREASLVSPGSSGDFSPFRFFFSSSSTFLASFASFRLYIFFPPLPRFSPHRRTAVARLTPKADEAGFAWITSDASQVRLRWRTTGETFSDGLSIRDQSPVEPGNYATKRTFTLIERRSSDHGSLPPSSSRWADFHDASLIESRRLPNRTTNLAVLAPRKNYFFLTRFGSDESFHDANIEIPFYP